MGLVNEDSVIRCSLVARSYRTVFSVPNIMELPDELCFIIAEFADPNTRWALLHVNRRWRCAALDVSSHKARKFCRRYRSIVAADDLLTILCVPFAHRQSLLPELIGHAFKMNAGRLMCFFINCESDHYKTRYWVARLGLSWSTTNRLYSRGYDADSCYPGEPEAHGWAAGRSIRHLPTLREMIRNDAIRDYDRLLHCAVKAKNWELIELLTPNRVGGRICPRLSDLVEYDDEELRWMERLLCAYGLASAGAQYRRIALRVQAGIECVNIPQMHPLDWYYLIKSMARGRNWHLIIGLRPEVPFKPSLFRYAPPRFFIAQLGWLTHSLWPMVRLAAIARGLDPDIYSIR